MPYWDGYKRTNEVLDFGIDWADEMEDGETISSHSFTLASGDTSGVTIEMTSASGTISTVWLSGGIADTTAQIEASIVTSGGRTISRAMSLPIRP